MAHILVLVGLLALAAALAFAWWKGGFIKKRTLADLAGFLAPHMRIYRPDGEGPFPTLLLFHGCGGPRMIQGQYAEIARRLGVCAVVVDSLAPRHIGYRQAVETVCSGKYLRGAERAGDVLAAIDHVRALPFVDSDRLVIAGFSHGAWAIMDALTFDPGKRQTPHNLKRPVQGGFDGVQAFWLSYPFCGFPARSRNTPWYRTDIPVEVLLVKDDAMAPEVKALAVLNRLSAQGVKVTRTQFRGVTHGFDEPDPMPGGRVVHDFDATQRARAAFERFLKTHLNLQP